MKIIYKVAKVTLDNNCLFYLRVWVLALYLIYKYSIYKNSIMCHAWAASRAAARGGGGGVLGLEKGTDCGQLWLSRANNAKKEGLSSHYR